MKLLRWHLLFAPCLLLMQLSAPMVTRCAFGNPQQEPTETGDLEEDPVADPGLDFTGEVLPVLSSNCFKCHGPEKQKSGLRVDSRAGILAGGSDGPAIVPGNPERSLLISAIRREGFLEMPPDGPLPQEEIETLTEWVRRGAPWGDLEASPETRVRAQIPRSPEDPGTLSPNIREARNLAGKVTAGSGPAIAFSREIRPILSDKCYPCHGPDENKRKAGLRFDNGLGGYLKLPSGKTAIVPGRPDASALIQRVSAPDPGDRMPPPNSGKTLTPGELGKLERWILEGGRWQKHWSFLPPKRPTPPDLAGNTWPRNEIDQFILAQLEERGLKPSSEASRETLIRRLSLDLTGLPPDIQEVEQFLRDESTEAIEHAVDRLLESPRYGEHMARYWLDLARYADTNGYHIDNERYMWPWRDWVIDAFNRNMPFDQFTIEQLAGDLLPEPTHSQRVATGFNRNHMINFEGGAIPEEYQTQYVVDRVTTTSAVWLGLTMNCAQCHDHKFDPISQREFYQMYAFFNTVEEKGLDGRDGNAEPWIRVPTSDQELKLAKLHEGAESCRIRREAPQPDLDSAQLEWEEQWTRDGLRHWLQLDPGLVQESPDEDQPGRFVTEILGRTSIQGITAVRLELLSRPRPKSGESSSKAFAVSEFSLEAAPSDASWESSRIDFVLADSDTGPDPSLSKAIDGRTNTQWTAEGFEAGKNRTVLLIPKTPFGKEAGTEVRFRVHHNTEDLFGKLGTLRLYVTAAPEYSAAELGPWFLSGPYRADSGQAAFDSVYEPEHAVNLDGTYDDGRLKWVESRPRFEEGEINPLAGGIGVTYLYREIASPSPRQLGLELGADDALKVWLNGRLVHAREGKREIKAGKDKIRIDLERGTNRLLMKVVNYGESTAFSFSRGYEPPGEIPLNIEAVLQKAGGDRSLEEKVTVRDFYRRRHSPEWRQFDDEYRERLREIEAYEATVPSVMVMKEMELPRETHILMRGQYDQPGDPVEPDTPAVLSPLPKKAPRSRLGLARWLVDPGHPLTARVVVNRLWQQFFGTGLVKTAEDFGVQGEWPSHPELLDWLATEFIRSGWNVKAILRLIVSSATYRQSSKVSPDLLSLDPENRLLARGPRLRMDAEVIRDTALTLAGLLDKTIGGTSVRPYQPPGLWAEVAYGGGFTAQKFVQDEGTANYRRSLYTFWKRQAPPPNMLLFDAPNRETCVARRERTNTPLQALTLLNDRQFVEAARAFAVRVLAEAGPDPMEWVDHAFRLATSRLPDARERKILVDLYRAQLESYDLDGDAARLLNSVGEFMGDSEVPPAELAAWTIVASTLLNLDETITKG